MSLVVGVDSYVTTEEATEYIAAHYASADRQREEWEAVDEADREVYLRRSTQAMERLTYRGIKSVPKQALSFPRRYLWEWPDEEPEVPNAIRHAQIEEALEMVSPTSATEDAAIKNGAVKAFSIGHFSETYAVGESGSLQTVVASKRAQELLMPYTGGGYAVR